MKKTLFFVLMLLASPAYAYLDSGTGSMVIQMVIAAVAGALAMIKLYWQKVKKGWQSLRSHMKCPKKNKKKGDHDKA